MLAQWLQLQWYIAPVLAIPLAIALGARRANGPIIFASAGAILAIALRWLSDATSSTANSLPAAGPRMPDVLIAQAGATLLLAAWSLALAHAALARRWPWFAALAVAVYLSYNVNFFAASALHFCNTTIAGCPEAYQLNLLLLALGQAVGPILTLIYALRAPGRRQRQLPDGLVVSSLHDQSMPDERAISAD